ncbi:hypothetical protein BDQ12DRAFT_694215 [Crucibulum laeve]|uniref:Uncharacterized protein n=1 Tax=Crucibulum laeve TaxID=68775 RepID=A0A5C3LF20_9AGAR|nr:hypothetical protein BDQ12DRAFT_694215 [Crucibulum laeve]
MMHIVHAQPTKITRSNPYLLVLFLHAILVTQSFFPSSKPLRLVDPENVIYDGL